MKISKKTGKKTGNVGEWSELYVLIKLLEEGKIYSAKEDLQKNSDCYLPILKVLRKENVGKIAYVPNLSKRKVELYLDEKLVKSISTDELAEIATTFYDAIVIGKGSFEIENSEVVMADLYCEQIKAKSASKADIEMEVHDPFTNFNQMCGFSIKSDLGSPPTLFNSSQATNFKFEVFGLDEDDVYRINHIDGRGKIRKRVSQIPELRFISVSNETFSKNLLFIDTQMENILAEMLKIYYGESISACADLADIMDERDFLGFGVEKLYSHKLKKFLCAVALGLTPTTAWSGIEEANGGYIIVKEGGEVLAYHLHNRDSFEKYLLANTKFETPSTEKFHFGEIYIEGERKFIKLNLQVRFK